MDDIENLPQRMEIVTPNVEATKNVMRQFQQLKENVLDDNDIVIIQGKKFIKRSGWRKIALAFNITTEIKSIEREKTEDNYIVRVTARAIAPNGRVSEEIGISEMKEFTGNLKGTMHNIESKAVTRAINRAISNLVGGGELSAEEILEGPEIPETDKNVNQNDAFSKAISAVKDFLEVHPETKHLDIEVDDKEKKITVLGDIPSNLFSELKNVMAKYGLNYIGRKSGGGSIWRVNNGH